MLLLLLVLTVSCVTVSLVVAVLAFLDPVKSLSKWLLIAALISVTGLYIDALPAGISLPDHHELPFEFVSIFSTGLIWWLALSIMEDDFQLGIVAWGGMFASVFPNLILWVSRLFELALAPMLASILTMTWYAISTLLILHVLWVALRGYRTDLLGARRNMRLCIAVLPVIAIAANLMADFTLGDVEQRLFRVVFALPLTLMVMFWLLKFESAELNFETRIERNQSGVDPKDAAAHKRLIAIMEQEQAYLEPELSITGLSERVGIPQHQLRNVINRGMGFRNFYAFLSSYRIAAIKEQLADLEQARVPILTIALNGGFSSLATFNRAFKAEEGQTAGAYRKETLASPPKA